MSNKSSLQKKLVWSKPADLVLLAVLLAYHRGGTNRTTAFPAEVWITATEKANKVFLNRVISIKQVKTRCYALKLGWIGFTALLKEKGFHWDREEGTVIADDSVWERYLEKEPRAKQFRWKAIDYFDELSELYGDGPNITLGNAAGHSVTRFMARSNLNLSTSTPSPMSTSPDSDCPPPSSGSIYSPVPRISRVDKHNFLGTNSERYGNHTPHVSASGRSVLSRPANFEPSTGYTPVCARALTDASTNLSDKVKRLTVEYRSSQEQHQDILQKKMMPEKFAPFAEAVAKVIKLYQRAEISKQALGIAVYYLKDDPHNCILFCEMPDDLCLEWVEEGVKRDARNVAAGDN
ncbi:hypothetical protein L873DRAFT_1787418 [Choiromyces venosus 120613-1]|uniref:Myb/SANT-like domain-containing protein n=1 Tax=Choiromyces venosus 120613-1 TaxID=1336337 RepID=A0A3N4JXP8_9PEZI|nr:hypothetical protein L873DRAFT_1787418 [Choiromyces venosus 120613-1]